MSVQTRIPLSIYMENEGISEVSTTVLRVVEAIVGLELRVHGLLRLPTTVDRIATNQRMHLAHRSGRIAVTGVLGVDAAVFGPAG